MDVTSLGALLSVENDIVFSHKQISAITKEMNYYSCNGIKGTQC